jgi:hypothetical protein
MTKRRLRHFASNNTAYLVLVTRGHGRHTEPYRKHSPLIRKRQCATTIKSCESRVLRLLLFCPRDQAKAATKKLHEHRRTSDICILHFQSPLMLKVFLIPSCTGTCIGSILVCCRRVVNKDLPFVAVHLVASWFLLMPASLRCLLLA